MSDYEIVEKGKRVAKASASFSVVPAWLSFVFLWLFIGGCVHSCSMEGGLRRCIQTVKRACGPEQVESK